MIEGNEFEEIFDGVMVCTGHHTTPLIPRFPDQEKFRGTVMHTHSYKKPDGFYDKNVVVVGIGNSGGDAVVELSSVAKNVINININLIIINLMFLRCIFQLAEELGSFTELDPTECRLIKCF